MSCVRVRRRRRPHPRLLPRPRGLSVPCPTILCSLFYFWILETVFGCPRAGNDYTMLFSSLEIDYSGAWVEAIWWCTRRKRGNMVVDMVSPLFHRGISKDMLLIEYMGYATVLSRVICKLLLSFFHLYKVLLSFFHSYKVLFRSVFIIYLMTYCSTYFRKKDTG